MRQVSICKEKLRRYMWREFKKVGDRVLVVGTLNGEMTHQIEQYKGLHLFFV